MTPAASGGLASGLLEHYPARWNQFDGGKSFFLAGLPSPKRSIGFVPAENLVGRADFLFFSSNGSARIWDFWKWPGAIRFSRLFRTIG